MPEVILPTEGIFSGRTAPIGQKGAPSDIFAYQPNPIGEFFTGINRSISDFINARLNIGVKGQAGGSNTPGGYSVPRPGANIDNVRYSGNNFPTRTALVTGGTVATTGLVAYTATNPGVQQTTQSVVGSLSPGLNATFKAAGDFTSFLTQNPLILIGGLAIVGLVLLKK